MKAIIFPKKNNANHKYFFMVLQCAIDGKQHQYSTGTKIDDADLKKFWRDGRIIEKARDSELFKLNAEFDKLKAVAHAAFKDAPNWDAVREALDRHTGKAVKDKAKPISGFYDLLDALCTAGFKRDKDGRALAENSLGNYEFLRSLLNKYDRHKLLTFEDWTVMRWNDFRTWLENNCVRKSKTKKGLGANSIVIVNRALRAVLNEGVDKDLTKHAGHHKKGFAASGEPVKWVWLKDDEIEIFSRAKMPNNKLALIRDMFCCACDAGGLRVEEWYKMTEANFVDDGKFLQVVPEKTKKYGTEVKIFLTERFKRIMCKYNNVPPALPPYNDILLGVREAAKIAGLKDASKIKTHTARKSYVNNQIMSGMSTTVIKTVTGHRSDAFNNYVKIGLIESGQLQEQHAKKVKFGGLRIAK